MGINPLQRQKLLQSEPQEEQRNVYQDLYGLRENPFPTLALFTPSIDDPRRNGTIYDKQFRQEEEKRFFDLFIQTPTAGDKPLELGFIRLDPAAGGRGNGKSVFLHHIARRINTQAWEETWQPRRDDPNLFAIAVHVLPAPKQQKRFWELARLIFETLANKGLLADIDMNFRAALLLGLVPEAYINALTARPAQEIEQILRADDKFLAALSDYGIMASQAEELADQRLQTIAGPGYNARFRHEFRAAGYSLEALWQKWVTVNFMASDYQWRHQGLDLFVNGLIPVMLAAGYRRFFLLLDEFEKIYVYQTGRERDEFLDSLRQYFYERDSALVRHRFVTTILTVHPSIDRYLTSNWQRVGLDNLAPLTPQQMPTCSVELGASTIAKLTHLLSTYLDYFRMPESTHHGIYPFAEHALDPALEAARLYPRGALWYSHAILRKAAAENIPAPISRSFVEAFVQSGERPPMDEDEALFQTPDTLVNLKTPAAMAGGAISVSTGAARLQNTSDAE